MMRASAIAAFAFLLSAAGCKGFDPPAPKPFEVVIKVESDPGKPLAGAVVTRGNKTLATTDAQGRAGLSLGGNEGEIADLVVRCPDPFQSPPKPTSVRLSRLSDKSKIPEYSVGCPPTTRHVVVAVKAENGPNLPIKVLDSVVAHTDASGAAHFTRDVAPGSQFNVTIDTTGEKIKPQNPTRPFTAGNQDEIVLFEQKFEVEKKPVVYVAPPRPHIPVPINR